MSKLASSNLLGVTKKEQPRHYGHVILVTENYYKILTMDGQRLLGHFSQNPVGAYLLDSVSFLLGQYEGKPCAVDIKVLLKGDYKDGIPIWDRLATAPVLEEIPLEDICVKIINGQPIDIKIVGVRRYNGITKVIYKK